MNIYIRAMIVGFVATVELAVLMLIKAMMGMMPAWDIMQVLAGKGHKMMGPPSIEVVD